MVSYCPAVGGVNLLSSSTTAVVNLGQTTTVDFVLPAGGISAPIKLPDGYRIIKVAERRPALDRVKFEDVRDGLMYALNMARQKQSFEALVEQLKSKAKVESHPERLK